MTLLCRLMFAKQYVLTHPILFIEQKNFSAQRGLIYHPGVIWKICQVRKLLFLKPFLEIIIEAD